MSHGQQCEGWGIMWDNCWIALASENQRRGKEGRMGRAGLKDSAEMVKGGGGVGGRGVVSTAAGGNFCVTAVEGKFRRELL